MENFPHEPHHCIRQLKVSKENIMAALKHYGDTQELVENYWWSALGRNDRLGEETSTAYIL